MLHALLEENKGDKGQIKCFLLELKAHLLSSQEELSRHFLETSNSSGQLALGCHRHTINGAKGIYTTRLTAWPPAAVFFPSVQRLKDYPEFEVLKIFL